MSTNKTVLGRGFDGLIPTGFDIGQVAEPGEHIRHIEISKILANPGQPRREFDEKSLQELAGSIKEHGIIQPLVVTAVDDNFRIIAGERRYRAAKEAGLRRLPVIVRNHKELEELEIAIVENVQRVDLSPLEQALSIIKLRDQFSLTPKQIAKKLGKAETTVSNIIRLLQLPEAAIAALRGNKITEGHARAILALKFSSELQEQLLNAIINDSLSVRESEEWVRTKKIENEQKTSTISESVKSKIKNLAAQGFSVKVQEKKRGGVISFSFKNEQELKSIIDKL